MLLLIVGLGWCAADDPGPDRHGVVALEAGRAELDGERLELRGPEGGRYVGGWTSTLERVRWSFDAPRAGRYLVVIEYAAPVGRAGASFELEVADQVRAAAVQATGAVDRFLPQPLKEPVELAAGRQELVIRAVEVPRGFVMNVARVRLVPAGEGDSPAPLGPSTK